MAALQDGCSVGMFYFPHEVSPLPPFAFLFYCAAGWGLAVQRTGDGEREGTEEGQTSALGPYLEHPSHFIFPDPSARTFLAFTQKPLKRGS